MAMYPSSTPEEIAAYRAAQARDVRFPLAWPPDWPRSEERPQRARFDRERSMADACRFLLAELRRAGVDPLSIRISSNVPLRRDGLPLSSKAEPADRAAAVYFRLKGVDVVSACDRWDRVADNVWAIACDVEAVRARARWGVVSVERSFAAQRALPPAPAILLPGKVEKYSG